MRKIHGQCGTLVDGQLHKILCSDGFARRVGCRNLCRVAKTSLVYFLLCYDKGGAGLGGLCGVWYQARNIQRNGTCGVGLGDKHGVGYDDVRQCSISDIAHGKMIGDNVSHRRNMRVFGLSVDECGFLNIDGRIARNRYIDGDAVIDLCIVWGKSGYFCRILNDSLE